MRFLIGLNSLRALAILLVVVYHFFRGFLPGGFLGVEVFFVIAGFLISGKLLGEESAGGVRYGRFVLGRAKRILPMLVACILLTLVLGNFADWDMMTGVREGTFGAVTFSTNIVEILRGGSYEAELIPNVFGHTWFLGVLMQFYLLVPLVVMTILPLGKKREVVKIFAGVCFGAAAISMGLMVVYGAMLGMYTRAYFGLDSHVFGLMLGAGFGALFAVRKNKMRLPDVVAKAGLAGSVVAIIAMSFLVRYKSAGAFVVLPIVGILAVWMIWCVVSLQKELARPGRMVRMLEWAGTMSFGVYLFHYPVFLLLPSLVPGLGVGVYAFIAIVVSLGLTIFVQRFRGFLVLRRWPFVRFVLVASLITLVLGLAVNVLVGAPVQSSIAESLVVEKRDESGREVGEVGRVDFGGVEKFVAETRDVVLPYFVAAVVGSDAPMGSGRAVAKVEDASVLVIGDSVTLGAKSVLENVIEDVYVDAEESRFIYAAAGILAGYKARGNLPKTIVVSLATNEYSITDAVLGNIVNLAPGSEFVFVTAYAGPSQPRESQNAVIRRFAEGRANVRVADWWEVAHDDWSLMYADHIHLRPQGRVVYADLIVRAIGGGR